MYAPAQVSGASRPLAGHRSEPARPGALLTGFFLGAVLLAPSISIAGVVLLLGGRPAAGYVCLIGGIAYRVVASTAVRLWEWFAGSRG